MQQYLTLEEAAKYLQMPADDLREMAKKKAVRAFQDRGTWRFRSQDVEELARLRGLGSDAQLQLGEAVKAAATKKPGDSSALAADFTLDDSEEVPIGKERQRPGSSKSGQRSPKPGSDSDVRLVMDSGIVDAKGGDSDSKVKFEQPSSKTKKSGSDSGVRLVPHGDQPDSDVKLESSSKNVGQKKSKSPSDSDIRLQEAGKADKKGDKGSITEEIDLDAEAAKATGKGKPTQVANPGLPTQSPFELSEPDMELDSKKKKKKDKDSSSDFEIIAFDSSKSPIELGSGEIPLLKGDEEVALGHEVRNTGAGASGINLQDPADSGISLEDGGSDEIDFELAPEKADRTSKPVRPAAKKEPPKKEPLKKGGKATPAKKGETAEDSSSEFELSLDEDSKVDNSSSEFELSADGSSSSETDSSSEFELSLEDSDLKPKSDESSDSEFELTLDDEGGLAVDEEGGDIFEETNFDVPALQEDSAGDLPLERIDSTEDGSDFEISLDDDSTGSGERSGSQVVALDDDSDADDAAATVAKPRKTASKSKAAAAALKGGISDDDLETDLGTAGGRKRKTAVDEDEDDEDGPAAVAQEAEWGIWPIFLFPTVIVMFLAGIMGFETLRGMWGYHRASPVGKPVVNSITKMLIDEKLPD